MEVLLKYYDDNEVAVITVVEEQHDDGEVTMLKEHNIKTLREENERLTKKLENYQSMLQSKTEECNKLVDEMARTARVTDLITKTMLASHMGGLERQSGSSPGMAAQQVYHSGREGSDRPAQGLAEQGQHYGGYNRNEVRLGAGVDQLGRGMGFGASPTQRLEGQKSREVHKELDRSYGRLARGRDCSFWLAGKCRYSKEYCKRGAHVVWKKGSKTHNSGAGQQQDFGQPPTTARALSVVTPGETQTTSLTEKLQNLQELLQGSMAALLL